MIRGQHRKSLPTFQMHIDCISQDWCTLRCWHCFLYFQFAISLKSAFCKVGALLLLGFPVAIVAVIVIPERRQHPLNGNIQNHHSNFTIAVPSRVVAKYYLPSSTLYRFAHDGKVRGGKSRPPCRLVRQRDPICPPAIIKPGQTKSWQSQQILASCNLMFFVSLLWLLGAMLEKSSWMTREAEPMLQTLRVGGTKPSGNFQKRVVSYAGNFITATSTVLPSCFFLCHRLKPKWEW